MNALVLAAALALQAASPAAPPMAPPRPEIEAELQRGVTAYNAQDLAYFERSLAPEAEYIIENGVVLSGRENILALLNGFFARAAKPRLAVSDVITGGRGDFAWARFKWTVSHSETSRALTTAIFVRGDDDRWRVVSIQNTPFGHLVRPTVPAPASHPAPHEH